MEGKISGVKARGRPRRAWTDDLKDWTHWEVTVNWKELQKTGQFGTPWLVNLLLKKKTQEEDEDSRASPLLRPFWREILSRRKLAKNVWFGGKWGRNVKFWFLDPKRHILARNDVILTYRSWKSLQGVFLYCVARTPPHQKRSLFTKKLADSLCTRRRARGRDRERGAKTPYRIVMKFCTTVSSSSSSSPSSSSSSTNFIATQVLTKLQGCCRCPGHYHPQQILRPSVPGFWGQRGVKFPSFPMISIDFCCRP